MPGNQSPKYWFIGIVRSNTELQVARKLESEGYQVYVATQPDVRIYKNGRRKTVTRILIRSKVFIYCSEKQRREIVTLPYILRFMVDKASLSGVLPTLPVAFVPETQMNDLMFMLGHSDSPVVFSEGFSVGDRVCVKRGKLKGLCGLVINDSDGVSRLGIRIDYLGCASVEIDPLDIKKIN